MLAIGSDADSVLGERVNPFDHPRVMIHDYNLAEIIFQHALGVLSVRHAISPSPIVVLHVVEPLEGGLTSIEQRSLQEALEGAGARKVYIWEGHELSDEELKQHVYEGPT